MWLPSRCTSHSPSAPYLIISIILIILIILSGLVCMTNFRMGWGGYNQRCDQPNNYPIIVPLQIFCWTYWTFEIWRSAIKWVFASTTTVTALPENLTVFSQVWLLYYILMFGTDLLCTCLNFDRSFHRFGWWIPGKDWMFSICEYYLTETRERDETR